MAYSNEVTWTAEGIYYSNSTTSNPFIGPQRGRWLYGIISNRDVPFDVRCPSGYIEDPLTPKQVMPVSCSTDFRGYYFPSKDTVGEVWMETFFDERDYSMQVTQTWWCKMDDLSPL
jgi:hypothetical protein